MVWQGTIVAFLVSQSAWPMMYLLGSSTLLKDPLTMCAAGLLFIAGFGMMFYKLLPRNFKVEKGNVRQRNAFYYMCCLFAWSSTTSLQLALEALGIISGFMGFYLENGEPYMASPFGICIALCDGLFTTVLYLAIIYQYDNGLDYKKLGLYWFGGMLPGIFSVNIGCAIGTFAEDLRPSALLNLPYILAPIIAVKHLWEPHQNEKPVTKRAVYMNITDYTLIAGLLFSTALGFMKGLAALGSPLPMVQYYRHEYDPYISDPGKFGTTLCLFTFFYCTPVQIMLIYYYLCNGPNETVTGKKLSIILSGATSHLAFTTIFSGISGSTPDQFRMTKNIELFVFLNLLPTVVAHMMIYRFSLRGRGLKES